MSTRNIVPRADGEGSIGTSAKQWGNGFFKNLTVGALTKAVSVLVPADDANDKQPATTSWVRARFRSILETVLKAAGLKYNMAQNGYICFGDLFGGLILQWVDVHFENNVKSVNVNWPITCTFLSGIMAHAGSTNVESWISYDGKTAYSNYGQADSYAIGIFK